MSKQKVDDKQQQIIDELKNDLQRTRADFENYRKRVELEKSAARDAGESAAVTKLLPAIDTIDRAVADIPTDIADHTWTKGIQGLVKQLDAALAALDVARIDANSGVKFDPELHQAVQFDEDSEGETEVISEQLQAGYLHKGKPLRPAIVKATRQ